MTDARALRRDPWRNYVWIAIVLLLFVPVQVAALWAASSITSALGIGNPEREHFAIVAPALGGALMLIAVPLAGRLLGLRSGLWVGWPSAAPVVLAAVAGYVLFEDVRSGLYFETDHALPEIFIPYTVILLGSAGIGHRLAGAQPARPEWAWVVWAAAAMTAVLIGLTALKVATTGGDSALDSPLTVVVLVVVGIYAVFEMARAR